MRHTHPIATAEAEAPFSRDARYQRQPWDRGDGYDANDPRAPVVPTCPGCDGLLLDGPVCEPCTVIVGFEREPHTGLVHCGEGRRAAGGGVTGSETGGLNACINGTPKLQIHPLDAGAPKSRKRGREETLGGEVGSDAIGARASTNRSGWAAQFEASRASMRARNGTPEVLVNQGSDRGIGKGSRAIGRSSPDLAEVRSGDIVARLEAAANGRRETWLGALLLEAAAIAKATGAA